MWLLTYDSPDDDDSWEVDARLKDRKQHIGRTVKNVSHETNDGKGRSSIHHHRDITSPKHLEQDHSLVSCIGMVIQWSGVKRIEIEGRHDQTVRRLDALPNAETFEQRTMTYCPL